jgi:hypothetical protein
MKLSSNVLRGLLSASQGVAPKAAPRRSRKVVLSCDSLEGRVTPAHFGTIHHAIAVASSFSSSSTSTSGSSSSSSNTALTTAQQTLRNDIQTIELASKTTIGELTAIRVDLKTLAADGLTPSSASALSTFENSLVTANANGTLGSSGTALSDFEALYTSSPTSQQTTDLTNAYNALVAAVQSANITSANITTINTDYAAVLAAEGSTSTATYPYFSLVTGGHGGGPGGGGGCH